MGVPRAINSGVRGRQAGKNLKPFVKGGRTLHRMAFWAKLRAAGKYGKKYESSDLKAVDAGNKGKKGIKNEKLEMLKERALFYGGKKKGGMSKKKVEKTEGKGKNKKTKKVDLFKGRGSVKSDSDRNIRISEVRTSTANYKKPSKKVTTSKKTTSQAGNKKFIVTSSPKIKDGMQVGTRNTTRVSQKLKEKMVKGVKRKSR